MLWLQGQRHVGPGVQRLGADWRQDDQRSHQHPAAPFLQPAHALVLLSWPAAVCPSVQSRAIMTSHFEQPPPGLGDKGTVGLEHENGNGRQPAHLAVQVIEIAVSRGCHSLRRLKVLSTALLLWRWFPWLATVRWRRPGSSTSVLHQQVNQRVVVGTGTPVVHAATTHDIPARKRIQSPVIQQTQVVRDLVKGGARVSTYASRAFIRSFSTSRCTWSSKSS
jgi:hypothetical protein